MQRGKGMTGLMVGCSIIAAVVASSASAQVVWTEDFDSYAPGSGIRGQGGWSSWDDNPAADSLVTDVVSRSGGNSLDVSGDSDTVYLFDDQRPIDCGQWRISGWVYTPSDMVAPNDNYFLLLNTYNHGGPYHWSVSIHFSTATGEVFADWDNESLPLITDEWVEMAVEIDLDNDTQTVYYGGQELYSDTWTSRIADGGILELQALDLFAYGATSQYWDDFKLEKLGGCYCMTLEVDRLVGGLTSTWTMTDPAGSNSNVALVYGMQDGKTSVNGTAGYCATFGIKGVNTSKLICQKALVSGTAQCKAKIPNRQGMRVLTQAAMKGTCPDECMSNLLDMVVQ